MVKVPERTIDTTLSAERLIARVLTPERMSIVTLLDYVDYLRNNQLHMVDRSWPCGANWRIRSRCWS